MANRADQSATGSRNPGPALHNPWRALVVQPTHRIALEGGILSTIFLDITINVPSTVGFIALFGVAVQNGTVLVSFVNQLREGGRSMRDAILGACGLRFRALLMTAATTVLGLLPMVYAVGPGAEVQQPLAVVVIGGLITATLLTLFVLPALYHWLSPRLVGEPSATEAGRAA